MSKINRYEYEGKVIEIPLRWDEHSKKEIEDYSLFIEQSPIYTPEGRPILLTIEDACPQAVMVDDDPASIDCGKYRQTARAQGGRQRPLAASFAAAKILSARLQAD